MKKVLFTLFLFIVYMTNINADTLRGIRIDGKTCNNTSTIEECLNSETYSYDSESKTLTLNNYNGERIYISKTTSTTEEEDSIKIHLKGNNTITNNSTNTSAIRSDLALSITSDNDAILEVNNHTNADKSNWVIECYKTVSIEGGKITLNNTYDYNTTTNRSVFGIYGQYGIYLKNNSDVEINVSNNYNSVSAFIVGGTDIENPQIYIEKDTKLKINLESRNTLNSSSNYPRTYTYYSGTIGKVDVKAEGTIEENTSIHSIKINGKTCVNDSTMIECLNTSTTAWNKETNTLTLENYNGSFIAITAASPNLGHLKPVTIHLKGKNVITENSENVSALDSQITMKITAEKDASLEVNNHTNADKSNWTFGMSKDIIIEGGNIVINNTYDYDTTTKRAIYGISAPQGVFIKNDAKVEINLKSDYNDAAGIVVGGSNIENPPIHVDKNASLKINIDTKNKLNSTSSIVRTYTYYAGTVGTPDIKIEGKVEESPLINNIVIDGKTCIGNDDIEECIKDKTYSWNNETNTLTLNNYNGGRIHINGASPVFDDTKPVTIRLKGNNVITENSQYAAFYSTQNTNIVADEGAILTINHSRQKGSNNSAVDVDKLLNISGGNITINNIYDFDTKNSYSIYGVEANGGIIIKDKANVLIKTVTDYSNASSIVVGGTNIEKPKIYLEKDSSLKLDIESKNKLSTEKITEYSYVYYAGTIGSPDIKIDGNIEEAGFVSSIYIDGKKCYNNAKLNECVSSDSYSWDKENRTITLNNYNGGRIEVHTVNVLTNNHKPVKIYLKGKNIINEKGTVEAIYSTSNIVIDADKNALLDINYSGTNKSNQAVSVNKTLTIQGGSININSTYTEETTDTVFLYGVKALEGLIIKDDANVKINVNNDYNFSIGIVIGGYNITKPKLYIENPSSVEVNLITKNKLNKSTSTRITHSVVNANTSNPDIKITGSLKETKLINYIIIDDKQCNDNGLISECINSETYSWDDNTKTLTLNNYNGGRIYLYSSQTSLKKEMTPIKIYLKGNNRITEKSTYTALYSNTDITIDADEGATLEINHSNQNDYANMAVIVKKLFVIQGGNININDNYNFESTKNVTTHAINATDGLIIKDNANVKIEMINDYSNVSAIVVGGENIEKPKLYVEDPASLEISLKTKNKLKSETTSKKSYAYYIGTIGGIDLKLTGKIKETSSIREIIIDDTICINDENLEDCLSNETYSWNEETNTLTLNNFKGKKIRIQTSESNFGYMEPVRLHIIGNNEIINEEDSHAAIYINNKLDLIITSEENASLKVIKKNPTVRKTAALCVDSGDFTIESGKLILKNEYKVETDSTYFSTGLDADEINIRGKSDIFIDVKTDYSKAYGIAFNTTSLDPTIYIDKTARLEINTYSKNLNNYKENMNLAMSHYTDEDKTINVIYNSVDGEETQIYAGDNKNDSSIINDKTNEISKYAYFKIEPKTESTNNEEITNPKTNDLTSSILIVLISLLILCIPGYIIIKKKSFIK